MWVGVGVEEVMDKKLGSGEGGCGWVDGENGQGETCMLNE